MAIKEILLLGNPKLYERSANIDAHELPEMRAVVQDLHDTLIGFRAKYQVGRAIAAPQIGVMKRLIYMHIDKPVIFINPIISRQSDQMIELWDDCMSFPDLLVKVRRYKSCHVDFLDLDGKPFSLDLEDDLAELLQHEYDHLDGILAVARAINGNSFALSTQRKYLNK